MADTGLNTATMDHLADAVRTEYRAAFNLDVAEGRARPMVLPISILGYFILPTLWLAIPHSRGGWMGRARWLVVAFTVGFDLDVMWRTSSTNMAAAYGAGLTAGWGMISTLNVLVWTKPQMEAARIVRRVREAPKAAVNENDQHDGAVRENGLRHRKQDQSLDLSSHPEGGDTADVKYEHIWQPFPEDASFLQRLNWASDIMTNFRFTGKKPIVKFHSSANTSLQAGTGPSQSSPDPRSPRPAISPVAPPSTWPPSLSSLRPATAAASLNPTSSGAASAPSPSCTSSSTSSPSS